MTEDEVGGNNVVPPREVLSGKTMSSADYKGRSLTEDFLVLRSLTLFEVSVISVDFSGRRVLLIDVFVASLTE